MQDNAVLHVVLAHDRVERLHECLGVGVVFVEVARGGVGVRFRLDVHLDFVIARGLHELEEFLERRDGRVVHLLRGCVVAEIRRAGLQDADVERADLVERHAAQVVFVGADVATLLVACDVGREDGLVAQDDMAVPRELHVALDCRHALGDGERIRVQRVLRPRVAPAAMRFGVKDAPRIRIGARLRIVDGEQPGKNEQRGNDRRTERRRGKKMFHRADLLWL